MDGDGAAGAAAAGFGFVTPVARLSTLLTPWFTVPGWLEFIVPGWLKFVVPGTLVPGIVCPGAAVEYMPAAGLP